MIFVAILGRFQRITRNAAIQNPFALRRTLKSTAKGGAIIFTAFP
jgi:hypothetical protein